jgi:prophage DNA circulation protein
MKHKTTESKNLSALYEQNVLNKDLKQINEALLPIAAGAGAVGAAGYGLSKIAQGVEKGVKGTGNFIGNSLAKGLANVSGQDPTAALNKRQIHQNWQSIFKSISQLEKLNINLGNMRQLLENLKETGGVDEATPQTQTAQTQTPQTPRVPSSTNKSTEDDFA